MATRAKRPRSERRERERELEKLRTMRERLFAAEPGGSPKHPIEVDSPAVVEVRALSAPCPRCEGPHLVEEHAAVTVDGQRLREARLRCERCGSRRSLWFHLPVLN